MRYTEIIATVSSADADRASEVLRQMTGSGVWLDSPFVQPDLESDAIVDHGAAVRIHAYARASLRRAELEARATLSDAAIEASLGCSSVSEEDWAESWKEYFHVERFGRRIVVVPSWRVYTPAPDDIVITLDPGMAFGTGQHETTRMCLEALERCVRPGDRVIDVGCGSGILSLAAAKLGASDVRAVDVDPDCVRITMENAGLNAVDTVIHAQCISAERDVALVPVAGGADVVVVNIIARVIIDLAKALLQALAPEGRIIASGIIAECEDDVRTALSDAGARVVSSRAMGDWRCLEAVRAAALREL